MGFLPVMRWASFNVDSTYQPRGTPFSRAARRLTFFFFQAEDGIRDYKVTGVQTCALPISAHQVRPAARARRDRAAAPARPARGADGRRGRPARFRSYDLVRRARARRYAAADRRAAQWRAGEDPVQPGHEGQAERHRHRPADQHAGGIRRLPPAGNREMGRRSPQSGTEGRLAAPDFARRLDHSPELRFLLREAQSAAARVAREAALRRERQVLQRKVQGGLVDAPPEEILRLQDRRLGRDQAQYHLLVPRHEAQRLEAAGALGVVLEEEGVGFERAESTLGDALVAARGHPFSHRDRKSTRLNSSHLVISYAVFCLKKKKIQQQDHSYDRTTHVHRRWRRQTV